MKKFFIVIVIVLASSFCLLGQDGGHKFEVGGGYAPIFLFSAAEGGNIDPYKIDGYFEWRYDFGGHWDIGAKIDYKYFPLKGYDFDLYYEGVQHYGAVLALADFNILPGKAVNPFVGIGLGPGLNVNYYKSFEAKGTYAPVTTPEPGWYPPQVYLVIVPRIGVELFHHLRLSASIDADVVMYNTRWPVCFNVGWTF